MECSQLVDTLSQTTDTAIEERSVCVQEPCQMARSTAPEILGKLVSLRIANIPEDLKDDVLLDDLKEFGTIGDFYRPTNLYKLKPSPYAFVRYYYQEDADNAKNHMHGKQYGDRILSVFDANQQDSYFTQDTGFITNEAFDTPKVIIDNFDGSLPETHYEIKRRNELLLRPVVYAVRVSDIPMDVRKEQLEELFGVYGEISSIYYPMDLKQIKPRGFAFIRFLSENNANDAVACMHGSCLLTGTRSITVTRVAEGTPSYFSQNESLPVDPGKRRK